MSKDWSYTDWGRRYLYKGNQISFSYASCFDKKDYEPNGAHRDPLFQGWDATPYCDEDAKFTLPLYVPDDSFIGATPLVTPGTKPQFNTKRFEFEGWQGDGIFPQILIKRYEEENKIEIYDMTEIQCEPVNILLRTFDWRDFPDHKAPYWIIVELQGGGGEGAHGNWNTDGSGGGGGGYWCGLVQLSEIGKDGFLTLKAGNGGGTGEYRDVEYPADGGSSSVVKGLTTLATAYGGKGGRGGDQGRESGKGGGASALTDSRVITLASHVGGDGGYGGRENEENGLNNGTGGNIMVTSYATEVVNDWQLGYPNQRTVTYHNGGTGGRGGGGGGAAFGPGGNGGTYSNDNRYGSPPKYGWGGGGGGACGAWGNHPLGAWGAPGGFIIYW